MAPHLNPKSKLRGAALLITIIVISIICVLLLSTQLILIRQSYQATYGYQRNEQTLYNSMANIYDALWWTIKGKNLAEQNSGPYKGYDNSDVTTNLNGAKFSSQTTINDSTKNTVATFDIKSIPRKNRSDIVLLLDRSASMAGFDAITYANCLSGSGTGCECLILNASGQSDCPPLLSLRSGLTSFFGRFSDAAIYNRFRLGVIIFGADAGSPSAVVKIPSIPANTYFKATTGGADVTNFYNTQVAPVLNLPSGYSNVGLAVNQAVSYYNDVLMPGEYAADENYYQYIIILTDGAPTAYKDIIDHKLCNPGDTACFNAATTYTQNEIKTAADAPNNRCILILGYGTLNTATQLETKFLVNTRNNVTCGSNFDLDTTTPKLDYVLMATTPAEIGPKLEQIAKVTTDHLNSFTLDEENPN